MPYFALCSSFMVCFYALHRRLAHDPVLDFLCCGALALLMCFVCPMFDRWRDSLVDRHRMSGGNQTR